MFHPTQSWLFRSIALKIHQPLPLNSREAEKLLNLIKTSFRQQLEREHGLQESNEKFTLLRTSNHPSRTTQRWNSQSKKDGQGHTDRHMHSMLTNPLFGHSRMEQQVGAEYSRDPMDIFDEACVRGLMTVEYAGACLAAKKRIIVQSAALAVRDVMKSSGAGLKVLRWLVSSGIANETTFLQTLTLSSSYVLVQFLIAEELQTAIWNWLDRLFIAISRETNSGTASPATNTAALLLCNLVRAETADYGSLDAAFASLQKANCRLDALRCSHRYILGQAGRYLSREISWSSSSHPPPSPTAYNSFLKLVSKFTCRTELYMSQLLLHHPSKPDGGRARKFLEMAEMERDTSSWSIRYPASRIIDLGLDTAKYYLERRQQEDIRWVMEFLQRCYAGPLALDCKRQFTIAKDEASSLELLDSLNLA